MPIRFFPLITALLMACLCTSARAESVIAFTEDFPPYNYLDQHGRPAGFSVDVLAAWLNDAGIDYRIEFLPWARALQSSRTQPNSLLFTAARTPEREPIYEWIGPFAPRRTMLMGLRSGPHPATLDAARSLRIGVINGDAGMEYLKSQGFVVGQNLVPVSQRNDLVRLLAVKGIDLIAANPFMLRAVAARAGQATADIENVMTLVDEPRGGFYFAVNKQTDPALLRKLQAAFQHLRDSGQLAALQARHHIN